MVHHRHVVSHRARYFVHDSTTERAIRCRVGATAVRREFYKRRAGKDQMHRLFRTFAFVQPCNNYEQSAVELYLIERARLDTRYQGEAEAVVQAAQVGATVIVDDAWGQELARKSELEVHGTFWLLQQFYSLGLLSASALRESFATLREND